MEPSTSDFSALRAQRIQLARGNLAAFVEYVGKDERTGAPIVLEPMHVEMLDFVERNPLALVFAFVDSGKSFLLSAMRSLFLLGRDPSSRIVICSSAHSQAVRTVRTIARYIAESAELHDVFPHLRPGDVWRDDFLIVERKTFGKDASALAIGIRGALLGARADHIILDDVDDRESTATEHTRRETLGWIRSTLLSRLATGGTVVMVATPWTPDDVAHTLAAEGWPLLRLAVTDDEGRLRWPSRWPQERIDRARQTMSLFEAARALDVEVRDEAAAWFKKEWIEHALARGHGKPMLVHLYSKGTARAFIGVDLAVSKSRRADKSAFAVVLAHENGDRELVHLTSARLDADEIMRTIIRLYTWFSPVSVVVESVAAQMYLVQLLKSRTSLPVVGFNTGRGKMSLPFQCELLASEFANSKWLIRGESDDVIGLAKDLMYYSPQRHTPDRVAAVAFARWGIERGERYAGLMPSLNLSRR